MVRWSAALRAGALALLALVLFSPAAVRPAPGSAAGRPPAPGVRAARLDLVGALKLEPAGVSAHADVALFGSLAFVGQWSGPCPGTGVDVVDLSNPAAPVRIGHTPEHPGASMEVMRALRIGARDVLAIGLQDCGRDSRPSGARAGLELVDVTDPHEPAELSFFDVDAFGPRVVGVHELDVVRTRQGRSLALLAVPGLEAATADGAGHGGKGDLLVVDIGDPVHPVLAGSWGVLGEPALGPAAYQGARRGNDPRTLLHSVHAGRDGAVAYLSYWDAGVIVLDLGDPSRPRYLGRTVFAPDDEGNAHSVAEARGGRLVIQADEVLNPFELRLTSDSVPGPQPASQASFAAPLSAGAGAALSGPVTFVGRGCPGDPYAADPSGRVALVERGTCRFDQKVARAQRAGATGVVLFDDDAEPSDLGPVGGEHRVTLPDGPVDVAIPAVLVRRDAGLRLKDAASAATVSVAAGFTGWGDLRIWDVGDGRNPVPVGRFATPEARNASAAGRGLWSVHNPVVAGDTLYASWYSDGVRAIDISRPEKPREIASWTGAGAPEGSPRVSIWGVAVRGDLVVASDLNFGLYVLRLTR